MKVAACILFFLIVFQSCQQVEEAGSGTTHDPALSSVQDSASDPDADKEFHTVPPAESKWVKVRFPDVTIRMEKMDMGWDAMYLTDNDSVYLANSDTATFDLWAGDWFDNKKIMVEQSEYDEIELYEKIRYKMAMNSSRSIEVPFCVMNGWMGFESDWTSVQFDEGVPAFRSNEEQTNPEFDYTVEGFKDAVRVHCGKEWYNEIADVQSVDELPGEIFASQYLFKIVLRNSETGASVEKFIVFHAPVSA